MEVISYTELRKNLSSSMNKVTNDHNPLVITRQNAEPMVLMSIQDFNAYEEKLHLLSTPANAELLRRSIADVEAGNVIERNLIEE